VKREHESANVKAQKMMRGKMEPSTMPTMVWVVPTFVHVAKQTIGVPHIASPHES
jgi:hypothetical protein